jgi:glucose-6-phosphate isomerase
VWEINSFDQWGVELGKVMANQLAPLLTAASAPSLDKDSSTNTLIARYRTERGR